MYKPLPSAIHQAYKTLLNNHTLSANPGQSRLVDRLATLQQTLVSNTGPQHGLYIYGDVGTGKSRLADLFVATTPTQISRRRVHFHEFMMDVHSRLHLARSRADYSGDPLVQIGREIRSEARLLCFDEFQVTDIADAMILKRLLGAVWEDGGVMVATSNRHPVRLYERGLNRALFIPFIDELQRRCELWKIDGQQDYRVGTNTEAEDRVPIFFTNQQDFDEDMRRATEPSTLSLTSIPVMMSRSLNVDACPAPSTSTSTLADNSAEAYPTSPQLVVKTTFQSLCETPLGSADYHALCSAANTVYLAGLRQIQADELDFTRRFITLIDIAYECKTRVVCLSSVPLHDVFSNILASNDGSSPGLELKVRREGGSSSSMMSTFIGETEWSATGLAKASLASGGAGETDVKFAIARALSRLSEMGWKSYGKSSGC